MKVAIVTESFLPTINGVTTSVCRVAECLGDLGHEVLILCPRPAPSTHAGQRVHPVPSVTVRSFPTGLPLRDVRIALSRFAPDVLHVASPFVLGARALHDAVQLGIPSVAVYQTDMPAYLAQHAPSLVAPNAAGAAWRWIRRVHSLAGRTLAPSRPTLAELVAHDVPRTALWARGVDTRLFHPSRRWSPAARELRARLAPGGEVLVGYVGRLAPEKELERLCELTAIPGIRLVIVGDGPSRDAVAARLPAAARLGHRTGEDLATAYAALDVFVHPGTRETFGQTLQEAAATGLPVVAPARGGPLDIVGHGRTGLLFDPAEPGALRASVGALVGNPARRESMGAAGRASVADRTWPMLTSQLVGHYDGVRRVAAPAA